MPDRGFVLLYVTGLVGVRILSRLATHRGPEQRDRGRVTHDRVDFRERLFMGLFLLGGLLLPALALGPWPSELAYALPEWASWAGVAILICSGVLHRRAHADLGGNYSATVRARETQSLVTDGVYAWMRHPIYASLWLIVIAQPLLVHHWIYGLSGLLTFALLYFHRLPREEAMMIKVFGDEYRAYARRVGRILPTSQRR